jgi:pimeloyl-ACP methyl ester carboxylesterase
VQACADYWRGKGIDLAAFNTVSSADDLEDLRVALREEKLSLLAHSYGTSLALTAARRHGEHLERVALAGAVGPDQNLHMPLVFDFALRKLSDLAAAAPELGGAFPDTYREFRQLVAQLGREPLTIPIRDERTKQRVDVKVGGFGLQFVVKDMLPNGRRADRIPALVYSLKRGDPALLIPMVQDLNNGLVSGFTAMQFAVSCSDGCSPERRRLAEEQATHSVFGYAPFVHLNTTLCKAAGGASLGPDYLLPVWSSVPTLLVSGTLDSNTPGFQAEEILWGLPNGVRIAVENGFHETLPSAEVQKVVLDFFSGAGVRGRSVKFAPPSFLTNEKAKALPGAVR